MKSPFFGGQPPLVLIIIGAAVRGIRFGRIGYPVRRNDLRAVPIALVEIQATYFGKIAGPGIDAAESFFQPFFSFIVDAPTGIVFHTQGLPDLFLQVLGDGFAFQYFIEDHSQYLGITAHVVKSGTGLVFQFQLADDLSKIVAVINAGSVAERIAVAFVEGNARGHLQQVLDGHLFKAVLLQFGEVVGNGLLDGLDQTVFQSTTNQDGSKRIWPWKKRERWSFGRNRQNIFRTEPYRF